MIQCSVVVLGDSRRWRRGMAGREERCFFSRAITTV